MKNNVSIPNAGLFSLNKFLFSKKDTLEAAESEDVDRPRPIILAPWEEAVGPFCAIDHEGGGITARIGRIAVLLPIELEKELIPRLGQRIAIIRTDDPTRAYRIRCVRGG